MLFRKLIRTMGLYKAQFISMIIMIAIGIGVFTGFNAEWKTIEYNTNNFFESTGFSDYRIMEAQGFSEEDLESVEDIDGVEEATRFFTTNVELESRGHDAVALSVTENPKVSGMQLIEGEKYDPECKDGIWLSDQYARENKVKLGDEIKFKLFGESVTTEVKGLIKSSEYLICMRDKAQILPDFKEFGFAYISPKMYEDVSPMPIYTQINVLSDLNKEDFSEEVDDAFGRTMMIIDKEETASYSGSRGEMDEGKIMASILPVIFLAIALLTMITTMHRITAKEKVQIGTLKALGFKDKKILRSYMMYAIFTGIAGIIPGIGLGFFMGWYIMNPNGMMAIYLDLPEWTLVLPTFCYPVLVLILILLAAVGYFSTKKMLKGTAAEALAPYVPDLMKPMKIEHTKWFEKRSFGTKWNLRDIFRHKARTVMSLFGVFGCTMLLMASFGLQDTMSAFLDSYYSGMVNYQSRIYLEADAEEAEVDRIIEEYGGDWSSTMSVKLDGDPVALEVFKLGDNMISLNGENEMIHELPSDGAYICKRIADDYGYKKGDEITVSPYNSEDEYTFKVEGVIRNLTEGLIISPEYAKAEGVDYKIDSVYSDHKAKEVEKCESISSVKSKKSIVSTFGEMFEIMDVMVYVLVFAGVILAVIVLYNLGSMSYMERYRELATLKVVGFKDKKIGHLLTEQNMWITILGSILGIPAGYFALSYLMDALAKEYELSISVDPSTYLICIAITFGVSLFVSFMLSRKNKKIDMVEALKIAE